MNRLWFLLTFGLIGTAILVSLGVWQVQRLAWKEGILAEIEARIDAPPVPLPTTPDPETDSYLHVTVTGQIAPEQLRVLVSQKDVGAGYRIISPMQIEGRTVLVDRGFVRTEDAVAPRPPDRPQYRAICSGRRKPMVSPQHPIRATTSGLPATFRPWPRPSARPRS